MIPPEQATDMVKRMNHFPDQMQRLSNAMDAPGATLLVHNTDLPEGPLTNAADILRAQALQDLPEGRAQTLTGRVNAMETNINTVALGYQNLQPENQEGLDQRTAILIQTYEFLNTAYVLYRIVINLLIPENIAFQPQDNQQPLSDLSAQPEQAAQSAQSVSSENASNEPAGSK
jgi:hypothetical protein